MESSGRESEGRNLLLYFSKTVKIVYNRISRCNLISLLTVCPNTDDFFTIEAIKEQPCSSTLHNCITFCLNIFFCFLIGKDSPYSIAERRVPELIPVLGSQRAGDVSHKPDGRLPLLSARPAVTLATLKRAANSVRCC